jgi:N6-adenosine-specific RNA methylase IME4
MKDATPEGAGAAGLRENEVYTGLGDQQFNTAALSEHKRFKTVIADPPWPYRNSGGNGAAENHYPAMSIEAICALPVSEQCADDAVLFLWSTWPQLADAFKVIQAWGFEYKTGLPWIKLAGDPEPDLFGPPRLRPAFGTGFWVRGCSEPVLITKRGDAKPPDVKHLGLLSKRFEHSRKPDSVHELTEQHPGPYLELFARRERHGWTCWGNEMSPWCPRQFTDASALTLALSKPIPVNRWRWSHWQSTSPTATRKRPNPFG